MATGVFFFLFFFFFLFTISCVAATLSFDSSLVYANYRKDFYYPYWEYMEYGLPDPSGGGRLHLVAFAQSTGNLSQVYVDGELALNLNDTVDPVVNWTVDWMRIFPTTVSAVGEPLWISFHSNKTKYDQLTSMTISILDPQGSEILKGTFNITLADVVVTHLTTEANLSTAIVHLASNISEGRTISQIIVNGVDMTSSVLNPMSLYVGPFPASVMVKVPLASPLSPADVLSVIITYKETNSVATVGAARVDKEFFPIESWISSSDCPFPTLNDDNYNYLRNHGLDTMFVYSSSLASCGSSLPGNALWDQLAVEYDFWCLVDAEDSNKFPTINNFSRVFGLFLGDECDDYVNEVLHQKLLLSMQASQQFPSLLTYIGGHVTRMSGSWSGIVDYQGMDMYVAACAPHVQELTPGLRGSYDYMRAVKANHQPLAPWVYSQGLFEGWNGRNPDPAELRIQAMSVIAAASKGIMYFQSRIEVEHRYEDTWKELGVINTEISLLREILRTGDSIPSVSTSDGFEFDSNSTVAAIRSSSAIVVPVISFAIHRDNPNYNQIGCTLFLDMHWNTTDHTIDTIEIGIPADFGQVVAVYEVVNGTMVEHTVNVRISSNSVTFDKVFVSRLLMTRLFVLSNTKDLKDQLLSHSYS